MSAFNSALIKQISKVLIDAFAIEGFRIGPAIAPQFIVWSLGFWTYKLAQDFMTPLASDSSFELAHRLPAHLHRNLVISRIQSVLEVDEWTAQRLASLTLQVVRKSGLQVNTQKVLFDPMYADSSYRILTAMHDPDFPPTQASVAIALGMLPPLPATTLAECLNLIGPAFSSRGGSIAQFVTKAPTYLWAEPSQLRQETLHAFCDRVTWRKNKSYSAELGLGFCLVQQEHDPKRKLVFNSIASPVIHSRTGHEQGWHTSGILLNGYSETPSHISSDRPLADYIGMPITSLPRVKICPVCLAIYSDDRVDLRHKCDSESQVDARQIQAYLHACSKSGNGVFTTMDLVQALPLLNDDAVESFLQTHRHTLGLRPFEGEWLLLRMPKPSES